MPPPVYRGEKDSHPARSTVRLAQIDERVGGAQRGPHAQRRRRLGAGPGVSKRTLRRREVARSELAPPFGVADVRSREMAQREGLILQPSNAAQHFAGGSVAAVVDHGSHCRRSQKPSPGARGVTGQYRRCPRAQDLLPTVVGSVSRRLACELHQFRRRRPVGMPKGYRLPCNNCEAPLGFGSPRRLGVRAEIRAPLALRDHIQPQQVSRACAVEARRGILRVDVQRLCGGIQCHEEVAHVVEASGAGNVRGRKVHEHGSGAEFEAIQHLKRRDGPAHRNSHRVRPKEIDECGCVQGVEIHASMERPRRFR